MVDEFPQWLIDAVRPLGRFAGGQRLRAWGLSEVWRVRLARDQADNEVGNGAGAVPEKSVIVKRGTGEMAREARRYRELVAPLAIDAPLVLAETGTDPMVLVLQDVGTHTLEQRPSADGYRAAARALARMRIAAAARLAADPAIGTRLRRTTDDFTDTLRRAAAGLRVLRPDLTGRLDERLLQERLDRLAGVPMTVVHGDFYAKNLVYARDGRIVAVDWPLAYLHPHLGDLFCLMRDAGRHGPELAEVFAAETGSDVPAVLEQVATGRMCWAVTALRWVVEEGVYAVPESRGWLGELVEFFEPAAAPPP